jgi:3-deoxy-D-manno-octulosonic-acid transferase
VLFGPHTWNFRQDVARLLEEQAAVQVADAAELDSAIMRLLADAGKRMRLGAAGQRLVLRQLGATERTVALLERIFPKGTDQSGAPVRRRVG